ncbi:hypothetical protein [Nocardia sp. bgisy134]|uniref:hypothetical protein n=1 Tax=Nocardia sp. bgisy134 TaxID=3413789 RepID=UPI003D73CE18
MVTAIAEIVEAPGGAAIEVLHDQLADCRAFDLADDLVRELRSIDLPVEDVRSVARQLTERGTRRNAVALGIVMLGVVGDERDRELLLLLGGLGELTLYAAVALANSQPDRDRAVFQLARRVDGWGRVHAVQRLTGSRDPEIKAWLLRTGFRNNVMTAYLAHIAATTGDLRDALLESSVDDELLDGAADILDALIVGEPTTDIRNYPDALPVLVRYCELLTAAAPTLPRIRSVRTITELLNDSPPELDWTSDKVAALAADYSALMARADWSDMIRSELTEPQWGEFGFNPTSAVHDARAFTGRLSRWPAGPAPRADRPTISPHPINHLNTALELVLLAAFPAALADDVRVVAQGLPPARYPVLSRGFNVLVEGEHLAIPYRLCTPAPSDDTTAQLSATQTKILHCLYSRHSDGYVRQHHLNQIIGATDPWIVPFVIKLVGEYVVDIVIDIKRGLTDVVTVDTAQHEAYGRFAAANPDFLHLTSQRVASYWRCYYRNRYPHRYYPGRIVLNELQEAAAAYRAPAMTTPASSVDPRHSEIRRIR